MRPIPRAICCALAWIGRGLVNVGCIMVLVVFVVGTFIMWAGVIGDLWRAH